MTHTATGSGPLRVLVVDADDRVRESLAGLLGIGRRCIVVGTAGHPTEALAVLADAAPDVVVIDPRLPEVDGGRAFIARVRELAPETRILVLGWSDNLEQDLIGHGAHAFLRKTFRPRELVDAVLAAVRPAIA